MCDFREGYALKNVNLIKLKMDDLRPLFALKCVITAKPCQIAGPIAYYKTNCAASGGICPDKFQLEQFHTGRDAALIDF